MTRDLGSAALAPELTLPVQFAYESASEASGVLGHGWRIPQLESSLRPERGGALSVTDGRGGGGAPVLSSSGTAYFNDLLGTTLGEKSRGRKYATASQTAFGEGDAAYFTGKPLVAGLGRAFLSTLSLSYKVILTLDDDGHVPVRIDGDTFITKDKTRLDFSPSTPYALMSGRYLSDAINMNISSIVNVPNFRVEE